MGGTSSTRTEAQTAAPANQPQTPAPSLPVSPQKDENKEFFDPSTLLTKFDPERARDFIRHYEQEQLSYSQMLNVYHRNILTPHFRRTNMAAVALILLPGFTNLYYMFRPHSSLVNIMMYRLCYCRFGMPIACFLNFGYVLNQDLYRFVKEAKSLDARLLLERFKFLYVEKTEGKIYEELIEEVAQPTQAPANP